MKWFRKIKQWNKLLRFVIKSRSNKLLIGQFKVITFNDLVNNELRLIVVEVDGDGKMYEQIELTSDL